MDNKLLIGCHVSAAGGVFNAPKNAADLGCETFQIFTRPPMGGPAAKIDADMVEKFKEEMQKYIIDVANRCKEYILSNVPDGKLKNGEEYIF